MGRSSLLFIALFSIGLISIGGFSWYSFRYYCRWSKSCIEQEVITYIQREITVLKCLNFSPESELISMLETYVRELQEMKVHHDTTWMMYEKDNFDHDKKLNELIAINKKMLKSYVQDLQDYAKMKISTQSNIVRFSYDKVVRLTLALAELEKSRMDYLVTDEYVKKVKRMHEITKQSIAHSKNTLRAYLHDGLQEDNQKIKHERDYLTKKMSQLITLDKILFYYT